jgi:hypothetical protein
MRPPEPIDLLGALAEESRLRAFAALVLGARTTDEVAKTARLPVREALRTLTRLEAAGLAVRVRDGWEAETARLREAVAAAQEKSDRLDYLEAGEAEATVLRTFMPYGRLVQIPVPRAKRTVILDHIGRIFEPGRRYPEREVDALLRPFFDDYVTLRRHLIDEGILSREAGVYWRTGGTVDI